MLDSIFEVLWLIGLIAGSVIRALYTRLHKQGRRADDIADARKEGLAVRLLMSLWGMAQVLALFYVLTPWLDFADYRLPPGAGWVGAAVFAVALWLLWRSHADLGRNWLATLAIREEHSLVTHGVFHYIRHPMYAAHLLWGIAQALLLQNWIAGLAGLASLLPVYLLRIPREEQMMLEHFGEEYRLYMNRTGRFIPRLWR